MISFKMAYERWLRTADAAALEITPSHLRARWLARFVDQSAKLRSALTQATARQYAEIKFESEGDMDPEEAAEIFAFEQLPDDPGAPE